MAKNKKPRASHSTTPRGGSEDVAEQPQPVKPDEGVELDVPDEPAGPPPPKPDESVGNIDMPMHMWPQEVVDQAYNMIRALEAQEGVELRVFATQPGAVDASFRGPDGKPCIKRARIFLHNCDTTRIHGFSTGTGPYTQS